MRDFSRKAYACAAVATCLLAACADNRTAEVIQETGSVQPALSGRGDAFWQPLPGELVTHVYYCFPDDVARDRDRTVMADSLARTWGSVANLAFHDEGACETAEHAAEAVKVKGSIDTGYGITSPIGTRLRGGMPGWHTSIPYNVPGDCHVGLEIDQCLSLVTVHEFAHVLGFGHESGRPDFDLEKMPCRFGRPAGMSGYLPERTDTLITPYDPASIVESGYCRVPDAKLLSLQDEVGARAIYGGEGAHVRYSASPSNDPDFFLALRFEQAPAPGEANALYMQAGESGEVGWRQVVENTERLRIVSLNGGSSAIVSYGDTVAISDVSARWLSANEDGWLYMVAQPGETERWIVESVDESSFPVGSGVLVNAPMRLRSAAFGTLIAVESNGNLRQSDDQSRSVWRINGPFTPN